MRARIVRRGHGLAAKLQVNRPTQGERPPPLKAVPAVRIRSGLQTFHLANRAGAGSPPGGCFTLGPGPAGSAGELDPGEPRWQAAEMRTYGAYCPIPGRSQRLG